MHPWRLDRCFGAKMMLAILSVLAFLCCTTLKQDSAPQRVQIDTPDCFDLSLREDVPIKILVDEHMISLAYEEMMGIVDGSVSNNTEFVNVYLILTGNCEEATFVPQIARLTINIWVLNSADLTKTCYQWRLTDANWDGLVDDVSGEIITENQKDTVTGIRPLYTSNRDMNEYSQLYRSCLGQFLKCLNLHDHDELFKIQTDNLYKEKQLVL